MKKYLLALICLIAFLQEAFAQDISQIGIVLGSDINLRTQPAASAPVIARLQDGDTVTILKWTDTILRIGSHKDVWVQIRTANRVEGYVFGAYLYRLINLYQGMWMETSPDPGKLRYLTINLNDTFLCEYCTHQSGRWVTTGREEGTFTSRGRMLVCTITKAEGKGTGKTGTSQTYFLVRIDGIEKLADRKYPIGSVTDFKDVNIFRIMNNVTEKRQ